MTTPLNMEGAPRLPMPGSWLVYFRADKTLKTYPATASDVFTPESKYFLVRQGLENPADCDEYEISSPARLWQVMKELFDAARLKTPRHVYTIHANSVLAVLARWTACKYGTSAPACFHRPALVDIPEAVLAPSILSLFKRNSFNVEEYARILELNPEEGYDTETGLLLGLIKIYGQI